MVWFDSIRLLVDWKITSVSIKYRYTRRVQLPLAPTQLISIVRVHALERPTRKSKNNPYVVT